jgi:hypothetical protein
MVEEKPGGEAAGESRGGAVGEEGCTAGEKGWTAVLQRKKMYVAAVPLKKGGCRGRLAMRKVG